MKTFTSPFHTYTIGMANTSDVLPHLTHYMDYISMANNSVFSQPELDDLQDRMEISVAKGSAYIIYRDGVEVGFSYLKPMSPKIHFIMVLHTHDLVYDPIIKILLVNEIYRNFHRPWYLPKDVNSMANMALLNPKSYRQFRVGATEYIKLKSRRWDDDILSYLQLEEV